MKAFFSYARQLEVDFCILRQWFYPKFGTNSLYDSKDT